MPKTKVLKTKEEAIVTPQKSENKKVGQEDTPVSKKKKTSKKSGEDNQKFLPVIHQGAPTHISLETVKKGEIIDPADIDSQYVGLTGISVGGEKYYIQPAQFQKHVLMEFPEEAEKIRQGVLASLQELKMAWVKFGTAVIAVNSTRLFLTWGYNSFKAYCDGELQLRESAVYEIIKTTKFLMREQREVYDRLINGEKKALKTLPSYRSLYLLIRNKKQLEEKEKFQDLLESLLQGKYTVAALEDEIRKILGKKMKGLSREDILAHFKKICDEMKEFGIAEEVLDEALAVLEKMKRNEE